MSLEENKALIHRLYELWNRRELAAYYELYAPGFISHVGAHDMSLDQMKRFEAQMDAAFPDAKCTIDNTVAEGDKIAFQANVRMTHTGPFVGADPTGKELEMTNTYIVKIVANKISEWWGTAEFSRNARARSCPFRPAEEVMKEVTTVNVVKTDAGYISGTVMGDPDKPVHVYRGIPYAAPPLGDLRWKPPQPVGSWSGIRECTAFSKVTPLVLPSTIA